MISYRSVLLQIHLLFHGHISYLSISFYCSRVPEITIARKEMANNNFVLILNIADGKKETMRNRMLLLCHIHIFFLFHILSIETICSMVNHWPGIAIKLRKIITSYRGDTISWISFHEEHVCARSLMHYITAIIIIFMRTMCRMKRPIRNT